MSKGGSWKPLKDGRRRCGIFECGYIEDNLCCADCPRKDCKNRCLNAPERCGQAIPRQQEKPKTPEEKKQPSAKEPFYTEKSDEEFCRNYLKHRRI